jgi:catechol 2,3-dioxygenase-like lactoylglutathione lyase family enzyme
MIDHLGFGVSDIAASKSFFSAALAPLGISIVMDGEHGVGLGKSGKPALWLAPGGTRPTPMHIAFTADRRAEVDAFHRAALAAGGKDNGAPGVRTEYHEHYYGAFVTDPWGHNIEAVCHEPYLG